MGFNFGLFSIYAFLHILLHLCFCCLSSSDQGPNYSFMDDATSAPPLSYYDYIMVGGGTAGCPLAATLSQRASVLLLERGGSPYGNANITDLAAFGQALADLSPSSPSQRFVSEDGVISARARVLGGGSCLNAGFYSRASSHNVAAAGWDGRLVNDSYRWVEKMVAFRPPMERWQTAVKDGLLEAGVHPYNGFTYDHVAGTKVGGTIFDADGRRHTAADLLKYANPKGLKVLLHASGKRPLAHGVVYRDALGNKHKAYLKTGPKNEIIVSAGALGSPTLLMLSGLGPMAQHKAHNITVVADQPFVGRGMSDNPMNAVFVPSPSPVEISLIEVVGITRHGTYIEAAGGGAFSTIRGGRDYGLRFFLVGQLSILPPKLRTPEALAKAITSMQSLKLEAFQGGFLLEKILGPVSTGHLKLKFKNSNDNPSVTFNYFKDPKDLKRCVEGLKIIENIIESKAFSKFKYDYLSIPVLLQMTANAPVNLLPKHANVSTSLEQFCRDTVMTIWHYHGGCQRGKVVDYNYRVLGVDALRVIDGSTFKFSPGTNPQATIIMLGRYMGVKMLKDRFGQHKLLIS